MKSLKDYSLNITENEYHSLPSWSHSLIARYATDGFSAIATLHDKLAPTPSMEFGSLFDSFITKGKKTLDEYVVDDTTIAPAEKSVFDYLLANGVIGPFNQISSTVLNIAIDNCPTFASKYKKPETRMVKLQEAVQYYEVRRSGKKIVSQADWNDAVEMYNIFRNDEYLKNLFGTKNTKDVEYIYQSKFETDWMIGDKAVNVRIMPDLLIVNHKDKTVQIVDLKTSAMPAFSFSDNFIKYRYDLQAEMYSDVMRKILCETDEYKDYTVTDDFLFTDISRSDKVPVTWSYNPAVQFAYTRYGRTYEYKGWEELLGEILEYEETNAKVPSYIFTDKPNDILTALNR